MKRGGAAVRGASDCGRTGEQHQAAMMEVSRMLQAKQIVTDVTVCMVARVGLLLWDRHQAYRNLSGSRKNPRGPWRSVGLE